MVIMSFNLGLLIGLMAKDKEDKQQKIMKKMRSGKYEMS